VIDITCGSKFSSDLFFTSLIPAGMLNFGGNTTIVCQVATAKSHDLSSCKIDVLRTSNARTAVVAHDGLFTLKAKIGDVVRAVR
jgi:hypothetical protein